MQVAEGAAWRASRLQGGGHLASGLTPSGPQGMPGKDGRDGVPGLDGEKVGTSWRSAGEGVCGGSASKTSAPGVPPNSHREKLAAAEPQERRDPMGCR